ncbi:MAG: hypothetical protein ACYDIB_05315 [Desulfobulbia bacterium]
MKYAKGTLGLLVAIVIVGISLDAFGFLGFGNTLTWQEEVKLLDGRVITVTQKRRYEGKVPRESWLTFKLPEFGNKEITWHENLSPHVFNVHKGKIYVVGMPFTEREFRQYGRPKPSYLGYRYEAGKRQLIPFKEIPEEIYDTNLLIANDSPNGVKAVSFAIKAEELKDETLPNTEKIMDANYLMIRD